MKFLNLALAHKIYNKKYILSINKLFIRHFHPSELKIQDLSLNNYITKLQAEYQEIISGNAKRGSPIRMKHLQPVITLISQRNHLIESVNNLKELSDDKDNEMRKLAEEEKQLYKQQLEELDESLKEALLPKDEEDDFDSIVLEVNAGVGGQEAMLFASEMFDMYANFITYKGWNYEFADYLKTEAGGIRHGAMLVNGDGAYRYFRHEGGVHRVQRIPATERGGRIHTSTVSVLAIPQPDDIQVHIEAKDLRIETKRATGAGGQHVNTTDSAVRVVHLPSGLAVECQTDRSQRKNKEVALQRLRAKLYQVQLDQQIAQLQAAKKSQVKSNFRNEKIRTYNFNQDRITDHRLESYNVHNLKGFLLGGEQLDNLIKKIDYNSRIEILKQLIED